MSIQSSAQNLLFQLDQVLESLTDEDFIKPVKVLSGSSIGQHVRHTLEFFICLIDGRNHGLVNYDLRQHDEMIESDIKLARSVISSIYKFLGTIETDKIIQFEANYNIDVEENIVIKSSLLREVAYNIEHLIHHMAILKIGLRSLKEDFSFPEHFGIATSTIRHQLKTQ